MIVSDFVPAVELKAKGKIATYASGSPKWLKVLAIGNLYIDQFQDEPNVDWNSLYQPDLTLTTVIASRSFALPTTVRKLSQQESDVVRIIHTDGIAYTDYTIISATRAKDFANGMRTFQNNYVFEAGGSLYFNRAFTATDPQFGGTITIPAYKYIGHISADADVIPVDIPNWLVFATAAEYIRTDVTRQPQYGNIINEANQIMQVMKRNNAGQDTSIYQPWNPTGYSSMDEAFA